MRTTKIATNNNINRRLWKMPLRIGVTGLTTQSACEEVSLKKLKSVEE